MAEPMVIIAVCSALGVFVVLAICVCFYLQRLNNSKQTAVDEPDDTPPDVKKLQTRDPNSSWWRNKAVARSAVRFEVPEKSMTVETVQPINETDSSVRRVAIGRGNTISSMESDLTEEGSPLTSASKKLQKAFSIAAGGTTTSDDSGPDSPLPEQAARMLSSDDPESPLGKIQFSVLYDFPVTTLTVVIRRAVGLPAKDFSGTSDPYVKILLLPDSKTKMESSVKRRCLNPYWNETFCFEGFPYQKIQTRVLNLQIFDYDKFSRNDPIGEIFLPLCEVNLSEGCTAWKALQPIQKAREKTGEILVSLCYHPVSSKLVATILKGKNLKGKDIFNFSGTKTSDPYVKIWLLYKGKKVQKQKTSVRKATLNPVYNESFLFVVTADKIRDTSLLVTAMDHDRIGFNDLIGSVLLSRRSGPTETRHWNDMLLKPKHPIAQWHTLRS